VEYGPKSGGSRSYNLSITILSGFAPLAASALIERTGMVAAPAFYITACAALTFASTFAVARLGVRTSSPSLSGAVPLPILREA